MEQVFPRSKIKANLTEISFYFSDETYGHGCKIANAPELVNHASAQELAQMLVEAHEKVEVRLKNKLNIARKRKRSALADTVEQHQAASAKENGHRKPLLNDSSGSTNEADAETASRSAKRHKRKFAT
jgi:hypothetical protein